MSRSLQRGDVGFGLRSPAPHPTAATARLIRAALVRPALRARSRSAAGRRLLVAVLREVALIDEVRLRGGGRSWRGGGGGGGRGGGWVGLGGQAKQRAVNTKEDCSRSASLEGRRTLF